MATLQDLTRRIKSVSNTRKITKAMEMVAAAKLRRAQTQIETLRPFADGIVELAVQVADGIQGKPQHPLLQERDVQHVCILLFGGDRGLSGAYNANVLRRGLTLERELREDGKTVHWVAVGRKTDGSLRFRGFTADQQYQGFIDAPQFLDADRIGHGIIDAFSKGTYDRVIVVYNHFESAAAQEVITADLLPITHRALRQATEHMLLPGSHPQDGEFDDRIIDKPSRTPTDGSHMATHGDARDGDDKPRPDWFFEPDAPELLDRLLPTYVKQSIYRALLESTASFFGSQMSAMHNASENAEEIAAELTLQRNRARQAAITQEILEVVGGAEALN